MQRALVAGNSNRYLNMKYQVSLKETLIQQYTVHV